LLDAFVRDEIVGTYPARSAHSLRIHKEVVGASITPTAGESLPSLGGIRALPHSERDSDEVLAQFGVISNEMHHAA
jgi:hypothetical protein